MATDSKLNYEISYISRFMEVGKGGGGGGGRNSCKKYKMCWTYIMPLYILT